MINQLGLWGYIVVEVHGRACLVCGRQLCSDSPDSMCWRCDGVLKTSVRQTAAKIAQEETWVSRTK